MATAADVAPICRYNMESGMKPWFPIIYWHKLISVAAIEYEIKCYGRTALQRIRAVTFSPCLITALFIIFKFSLCAIVF